MLDAYYRNRVLEGYGRALDENAEQAEEQLKAFLAEEPGNRQAQALLAQKYLQCGEGDNARETLQALLRQHPDAPGAKTELAKAEYAAGNATDAIRLLGEVTSARPEIDANWLLLSNWQKQAGQVAESENALRQYEMIRAFNDKLRLAEQAFASTDYKKADSICRQLLELVPNEVRTLRLLAKIARRFQYFEFSTDTLARCVETRPTDVSLGLEYAHSLLASRRHSEALVQCRKLLELAPERIEIFGAMAESLYKLGRHEDVISIYRALADVPEQRATALLHLGKVLKTVGELDEATACFRESMAFEPTRGRACWELANLKTARFSAAELEDMQQWLKQDSLRGLDRVLMEFAVGKALEDCEDFAASFRHYETANQTYSGMRPAKYARQNEHFEAVFTAEYFAGRTDLGAPDLAPIFVVGMPRSGSTLVEQILSSHSQVDATSELDEIVSIARSLSDPNASRESQYPQSMTKLGAGQVRALAQRYLDHAALQRGQAPYFVDKAPNNFHHIGLIKTLFPNARIIDVRRDPMGCGWSLYRQFFGDSFLFSNDLETIGHTYKDYVALMAHWHAVLPGQVLTVRYEELVADLETTTRAMLDYCGLPFERACLDFHLNRRAVATPSSEQVRQPIYSAALEHWKNYEAFLGPLKAALADDERR